jgi:hypothetical protein
MPEMRTYTTQTQLSQLEHALNIESLQVVKRLSVFALADHSKGIIVLPASGCPTIFYSNLLLQTTHLLII